MNEFLNNNFLFGFLLARDREDQNQKLSYGLTAGQFPKANPLGLVLLKRQIDTLEEVEGERDTLQRRVEELEAGGGQDAGGGQVDQTPTSSGDDSAGENLRLRRRIQQLESDLEFYKGKAEALDEAQAELHRTRNDLVRCEKLRQNAAEAIQRHFAEFTLPTDAQLSTEQTKKVANAIDELRGKVLDIFSL